MKMKVQIPLDIELTEQQVREIVRRFLRDKYNLKSDFDGERYVEKNAIWEIKNDARGKEMSKISYGASAGEIAAQIVLDAMT